MMQSNQQMANPVSIEKLHQLQNQVTSVSNVNAIIFDNQGQPVIPFAELTSFCPKNKDGTGQACLDTYHNLFAKASASRQTELAVCPYSNLSCAALPIYKGDELICVWILCQIRFCEQDSQDLSSMPLKNSRIAILNKTSFDLLLNIITIMTEDMLQIQEYDSTIGNLQATAHKQTYYDKILELPNLTSLEHDLQQPHLYRYLIALDIANLRKIDDVYGRKCGNELLRAVRDYLLSMNISNSRLYYLDTTDFGLLLEYDNLEHIQQLAQELHKYCSKSYQIELDGLPQEMFIAVNVGVLPLNPSLTGNFDKLLSSIKRTVKLAKHSNGVAFCDSMENPDFLKSLELEMGLRQAVRENMRGFSVVYQPVIDPHTSTWRGIETLCRWNRPEPTPPNEFIPIAEKNGLINDIGLWVLRTAVTQIKELGLHEADVFTLGINVSPIQLTDPEFEQKVLDILQECDYPPNKLLLEITESSALNFSHHTLQAIRNLGNLGILIALDDFGSGYASFYSLYKLPIQVLKTDMALIQGLETDQFLRRLLNAIIGIAHAANMIVVIEGVETNGQAILLMKEGANYFQGFKYSFPLPFDELKKHRDNFVVSVEESAEADYSLIGRDSLSQGSYELTNGLYKLLNRCLQTLLQADEKNTCLETVLSYVVQELELSRACIFWRNADGTFANTHEWHIPEIRERKSTLQNLDLIDKPYFWFDMMIEDGMLIVNDTDIFGCELLKSQEVKSLAMFPFFQKGGNLQAFIAFSDCSNGRSWTSEEIQMLYTLSNNIFNVLASQRKKVVTEPA